MERRYLTLSSPAVGREVELLAFGHHGPPLIAFPSGGGRFFDFEDNGLVASVQHLLDAGRLKLYCPDSLDRESWLRADIDPHWRAVRHQAYDDFLLHDLAPFIAADCRSPDIAIGLAGCSLGAFHAATAALKHPERFRYALCMSGRYDAEGIMGRRSDSETVYFNNPLAFVPNLHGDALERVRRHTRLVLVCGRGAWEDKCLADTERLAAALADKAIPHELDLWGHDVEHHWYWWRRQFPHHLERVLGG